MIACAVVEGDAFILGVLFDVTAGDFNKENRVVQSIYFLPFVI